VCIIVYKPAKEIFDIDLLRNCFNHNPDGAGLMWTLGRGVQVRKGIWNFMDLTRILKEVPENSECLLHCRIKTHGPINKRNCHPHQVTDNTWMVHNGILKLPWKSPKYSDSAIYAMMVGIRIEKKQLDLLEDFDVIEKETVGSKLAFMTYSGEVHLTTPNLWNNKDGCLYSNLSHIDRSPHIYSNNKYSTQQHWTYWK
jgi:predicted glutamine amidotransferase